MVTKTQATEIRDRLAVIKARIILPDQTIRQVFDDMKEDLPNTPEDPDCVTRRLREIEEAEAKLLITKTFHDD